MFQQKFLSYVLYTFLLEIREEALKTQNSRLFHLSDILHNVPGCLSDNLLAEEEYSKLLRAVEHLNIGEWLSARRLEFIQRFPEFKDHK